MPQPFDEVGECVDATLRRVGRKVVLAAAYSDDETLKRLTNEEFAKVMGSEDTKEGLTAFIEKRLPNWQGK